MDAKTADLIQTIVYLLPIGTLVWRFAKLAARIDVLEQEVKRIDVAGKEEQKATDKDIEILTGMLNEIKIAVTRIETKLENRG